MRKTYQNIWIDLPYTVVQITEIKMTAGMNCHACLRVVAICEDEKRNEYRNRPVEHEMIRAGYLQDGVEKEPFFIGRIQEVSISYEKGQMAILFHAESMTKLWDIAKRRRTFQNMDYTYRNVIRQVLSAYPGALWDGVVNTDVKIPGFLLQYDETDWEFLCRLASHFGTYIVEEPAGEAGQIYFGVPELEQEQPLIGMDCYQISQDMERYRQYTFNVDGDMMPQDNLNWIVEDRNAYRLGEKVIWKGVACQIIHISMETQGADVLYCYVLGRPGGVRVGYYGNRNISGLSLPATIKERNGNRLRVKFDIDQEYKEGNNFYFTYAIETTSWYCLPEPGSTVHIYFRNWNEATGIAIQAMRLESEESSNSVSAKGTVSDKSFSTTDGKAMRFTDTGIDFASASEATRFTVSKDGVLSMEAEDIFICGQSKMNIGKRVIKVGEEELEINPQNTVLESKAGVVCLGIMCFTDEEVTMADNKGILMDESGNLLMIASGTLSYDPIQIDPPSIQYSDKALREEDAAQREAHNAEVFKIREEESKGKINVGNIVAGIGALCLLGAATVLTGGAALVAAGAGVVAYACGSALVLEGKQDLNKMESGDFSQSYNVVRDGIFDGNQELYETVMYGSVMIGVSVFIGHYVSLIPKSLKFYKGILMAGQFLTSGGSAAGVMYLRDVSDGYVDVAWQEYAKTFAEAGFTAVIGFAVSDALTTLGRNSTLVKNVLLQAKGCAPALIIGAETVVDVGVDWGISKIYGRDFDLAMSVLTSLVSNIAFSIDPVNMATGGFCLTATDLILPDLIEEHFQLQRIYNSVIPCIGGMGRNWMLGLESRLFIREQEGMIDVICMDGHAERFRLENGKWENCRQGDARYQLQKAEGEEGFVLVYIPEQRWYDYDSMGRLLSVRGKGQNKLVIEYREAHISRVITSAGFTLDFQYEGNHIVEIRDETGRAVRYKYEDDCLKAVCHVDEGVTTYHYDSQYHIIQVIDQNGHAYVKNEYDEEGRVVVQHYLDGTKSVLVYDLKNRENTVYIEGLGRTEKYRYNKDSLVTHTYYDDGTWEETGYDQWTNRIYEKDRNGNVTHRIFDCQGKLLEETLPSGQTWKYKYSNQGWLLQKKASTGEEICYAYDEYGFVIEESEKIREGEWKRHQYIRDPHGRMMSMTDSLGHITRYEYDSRDGHFLREPSCVENAMGNRTVYGYDAAGRRNRIETDMGTIELGYNLQNYLTYVRDGNSNELRRAYDKKGNLIAVFPPNQGTNGNGWMYRYDFFDRLVETRDPLGNLWGKERNLAGDILCERAPDGRETRYEYDMDSRKIRTIYADGSVERCFYDGNGNMIKKVRPENYQKEADDGLGMAYSYDSMNRLTLERDEEGRIQNTYGYNASGQLVRQTDGAGHTTFYTYDLLGNLLGKWEPVEQSAGGETLYRATLYEYDTESNKVKEIRGLDKVLAGENPSHTQELRFCYDMLNRLSAVEDPEGAKAAYQYNSLNQKVCESFRVSVDVDRVIHYEYDAAGNLTERREGIEERFLKPDGKNRTIWAITRYEYDPNGNLTRETTPKGYEREWRYDALDRVVDEKEYDKASGIKREFRYGYDASGNLFARWNDSLGQPREKKFCYDSRNRLTHLMDECGATTRLFYDRNDRIIKVVRPRQYEVEQDNGPGICYVYDCRDQVIRVTGPDGAVLREQTYDEAGNVISCLDNQSVYMKYVYNMAGDLLEVYRGRNNAEERRAAQRMVYDAWGNITSVEDGNRNTTRFLLDSWGRIQEIHTPEGGVERYTYDYAGNVTSTTDANGGTIAYRYNSMGQVYQVTDQEGCAEYFYYDQEGHRETHVDRNGNVERTVYNMDGSLMYQRFEDRKGRNPVVNQYKYYQDGMVKEAEGGGIKYHYSYTANGLLKSKSAGDRTLLEYTYDLDRNLIGLKDSKGNVTHYTYDTLGRMEQVAGGEGDVLVAYHYDKIGQLSCLQYGNGAKTEYVYGDDGNLTNLVAVTAQGQVLLDYDYTYDGNGNCTQKSGKIYQNVYTYDQMNRLVEALIDGEGERYTYDLAGNRLKKESTQGTEVYHYNIKNQLTYARTKTGESRYFYDRQGNLLEEQSEGGRKQYSYDMANRQVKFLSTSAQNGGMGHTTQSNCYDGEGMRYETEENGKVIRFLFDRGELVGETREEGDVSYIRGYNNPFCLNGDRCGLEYLIQDEAGSTFYILNQDQRIKKKYRYDAFGDILEESGEASNRLTYTGQMYDGTTGQYYLRARFYNPELGRFTQEDTYRGDGFNLYAYCGNNPVMYYDPSGYIRLCSEIIPGTLSPEELAKMIEFPGDIIHPGTVTPDNPWGIYTIRATGNYNDDRILLAQAAGISVPDSKLWRAHHIDYDPITNTMRMQFVDAGYHTTFSHFGGAGAFKRITGFEYGSDGAIEYARKKNIEYLLNLISNWLK